MPLSRRSEKGWESNLCPGLANPIRATSAASDISKALSSDKERPSPSSPRMSPNVVFRLPKRGPSGLRSAQKLRRHPSPLTHIP